MWTLVITSAIIIPTAGGSAGPGRFSFPRTPGIMNSQQWLEELVPTCVLTAPAETLTCGWETPPLPKEGLLGKAIVCATPSMALFERDGPTSICLMTPTNPRRRGCYCPP